MVEEYKIILKRRVAVVGIGKGHKYPRVWIPRDIVETLGITSEDKEVYVTLYEGGLLKIQKSA